MKILPLLTALLLTTTPSLANTEPYPGYICDELIITLVEAVELEIIDDDEAAHILMNCRSVETWVD